VPRLAFNNKVDRQGSNELRNHPKFNAAVVQIPMGLEEEHVGAIDLIDKTSITFGDEKGESIIEGKIPAEFAHSVEEKRLELFEKLADADDEIAEHFPNEEMPDKETLKAATRLRLVCLFPFSWCRPLRTRECNPCWMV
jgi:elongation factor G